MSDGLPLGEFLAAHPRWHAAPLTDADLDLPDVVSKVKLMLSQTAYGFTEPSPWQTNAMGDVLDWKVYWTDHMGRLKGCVESTPGRALAWALVEAFCDEDKRRQKKARKN